MEQTKEKTCKFCYKQLDYRAKKCPHCQSRQNIFARLVFSPFTIILPIAILFLLPGLMLHLMFDEGKNFTIYRDQIVVADIELKFGKNCGKPTVAVIGTIVNKSQVEWKDFSLELQFFNENGKLIDTDQERKYHLVIPANDSSRFKVSMPREFPEKQYKSSKVRVVSAREKSIF